ncbi:hypothetical protein H4S01_006071, partial [Coemansia sp. RSA 2610]
ASASFHGAGDVLVSPPPSAKESDFAAKDGADAGKAADEKKPGKSLLDKYRTELREVAEKCKILSQFAEQYGPERNKFNAQPSDDLVIDMARKAYEVLMVFMTIRRERMSASADNDTMEYIRKRRTVLSPARTKTRKRSVSQNPVLLCSHLGVAFFFLPPSVPGVFFSCPMRDIFGPLFLFPSQNRFRHFSVTYLDGGEGEIDACIFLDRPLLVVPLFQK